MVIKCLNINHWCCMDAVWLSRTPSIRFLIAIVNMCSISSGSYLVIARQRSWRKVMFLVVSVRHNSVRGGSHLTIAHDAFNLTVQAPPGHQPTPSPPDIRPRTPGSDIWWWPVKLKHVRFPSGRYASYWNTFLSLSRIFTWIHYNKYIFLKRTTYNAITKWRNSEGFWRPLKIVWAKNSLNYWRCRFNPW